MYATNLNIPKHVTQYISYTYSTYYTANACDMINTSLASFSHNLELNNILKTISTFVSLRLLVYQTQVSPHLPSWSGRFTATGTSPVARVSVRIGEIYEIRQRI